MWRHLWSQPSLLGQPSVNLCCVVFSLDEIMPSVRSWKEIAQALLQCNFFLTWLTKNLQCTGISCSALPQLLLQNWVDIVSRGNIHTATAHIVYHSSLHCNGLLLLLVEKFVDIVWRSLTTAMYVYVYVITVLCLLFDEILRGVRILEKNCSGATMKLLQHLCHEESAVFRIFHRDTRIVKCCDPSSAWMASHSCSIIE